MTNLRLFIALEIDSLLSQKAQDAQQELLLTYQQSHPQIRLRIISHQHFHVTLRFLGLRPSRERQDISTLLKSLPHLEIPLIFKGLQGFPSQNKARTLALSFHHSPQLFKLYNELNTKLNELNIVHPEKKFVPHLTLLRCNKALSIIPTLNAPIPQSHATQLSLFSSQLTPQGAIYECLDRIKLPT